MNHITHTVIRLHNGLVTGYLLRLTEITGETTLNNRDYLSLDVWI
jgi:hypothetical protein